ncbi:MAG: FAD:protein FMN transferase [Ferruginibacter sp.]
MEISQIMAIEITKSKKDKSFLNLCDTELKEYTIITKLMGSVFELRVAHESEKEGQNLLNDGIAEIKRIEDLLSEFRSGTITSLLNKNAGEQSVRCDEECYALLERCLHLSALTRGAFDITVGPLKKLYNFKNERFDFPGKTLIRETLNKVGYKKIKIIAENKEVLLTEKNMHISFAAIGKGYAADQVKKLWLKKGVTSGVINASGDLTTIGNRVNGKPWKIGIADPENKDQVICYIPIGNASVATSGNYEQYFLQNGVKYSHNIDPITGLPVKGIKSVSVISPRAELSDALATAVYIMGKDAGLHFINQLPDTHCILIDENNNCFYSDKINLIHEN